MFNALSSIGTYIVPFVVVLTIVVFFHELGHFLVGRWCGIKVDAFSIGFGPELFRYTDRHGTRWRLAAIPLGGYVKFHGDANGASMADDAALAGMPPVERAVTFAAQPIWKRAATVAAGPIANFILAIVIFSGVFFTYRPRRARRRAWTAWPPAAPPRSAGFRQGDVILEIDGQPIEQLQRNAAHRDRVAGKDDDLPRRSRRAGRAHSRHAAPEGNHDARSASPASGSSASRPAAVAKTGATKPMASSNSVKLAVAETWFVVEQTATYLGRLVIGRESPDQLSGPAGLAQVSGEMAKLGLSRLPQSGRDSVDFDRSAQSRAGSASRRRPPAVLRDRGHSRPRSQRKAAGDRVPNRHGDGRRPDGAGHIQRYRSDLVHQF